MIRASLGALAIACSSPPAISARDAADANDTGGALQGKNEFERAVLREVPALASGTARRVSDATVIADPPYTAASGRTCRALHLQQAASASERLACTDGKSWFFVPSIFGEGNPGE